MDFQLKNRPNFEDISSLSPDFYANLSSCGQEAYRITNFSEKLSSNIQTYISTLIKSNNEFQAISNHLATFSDVFSENSQFHSVNQLFEQLSENMNKLVVFQKIHVEQIAETMLKKISQFSKECAKLKNLNYVCNDLHNRFLTESEEVLALRLADNSETSKIIQEGTEVRMIKTKLDYRNSLIEFVKSFSEIRDVQMFQFVKEITQLSKYHMLYHDSCLKVVSEFEETGAKHLEHLDQIFSQAKTQTNELKCEAEDFTAKLEVEYLNEIMKYNLNENKNCKSSSVPNKSSEMVSKLSGMVHFCKNKMIAPRMTSSVSPPSFSPSNSIENLDKYLHYNQADQTCSIDNSQSNYESVSQRSSRSRIYVLNKLINVDETSSERNDDDTMYSNVLKNKLTLSRKISCYYSSNDIVWKNFVKGPLYYFPEFPNRMQSKLVFLVVDTKSGLLLSYDAKKTKYFPFIELMLACLKKFDSPNREWMFEILTNKESYVFSALSQNDCSFWYKTIEDAIYISYNLIHSSEDQKNNSETPNSDETNTEMNIIDPQNSLSTDILAKIPGNQLCADCLEKDPLWASISLGTLICYDCAGVHRGLGVHVSKVRSVRLDDWPQEVLERMIDLGNEKVNLIYEKEIGEYPRPNGWKAKREERKDFIYKKYVEKAFMSSEASSLGLA